jgi:hypothetical protein
MLEEQPDKNRANKNTKVIFFIVTRLNNINIGKIAIQEFEKQIKHNSRFANKRFVSNQENADATFGNPLDIFC